MSHLEQFDCLANARCDRCRRVTFCQGFEIPRQAMNPLRFNLCIECLIYYARTLSMAARGNSSISDLV